MCTATWLHERDGYRVLFNRDERTTRRPATPPRVRESGGVRFAAPSDGDFGGTWIAANELGVTVLLLNNYEASASPPEGPVRSRGLLVLDLASAGSLDELRERVERADLGVVQPFTVAALEVGSPTLVARWDSQGLEFESGAAMPLISSGHDLAGAVAARTRALDDLVATAGLTDAAVLDAFHRSHAPERGPYSTCMHRDDASTVSLTTVVVTPPTSP